MLGVVSSFEDFGSSTRWRSSADSGIIGATLSADIKLLHVSAVAQQNKRLSLLYTVSRKKTKSL